MTALHYHPIEATWDTYPRVPGAFWPCIPDEDASRAWVEKVDVPETPEEVAAAQESDDDAAWLVAQATGWPLRYAQLHGTGSLYPYVQPFAHDNFGGER